MLQFIIYVAVAIVTFRTGWRLYYDQKDDYTSDGEFQMFWLLIAIFWPLGIPIVFVWWLATIGRPKSPGQRAAEYEARTAAAKKDLFAFQVKLADLEHENGYKPADPPPGWVPKGHSSRYYNVEYKLS